jgi:hypothetical protein
VQRDVPADEKHELFGLERSLDCLGDDLSPTEQCLELGKGEVDRAQVVEDVAAETYR